MPKDDGRLPRVSDLLGASIPQCIESRRKERTRGLYPYSPPPYRLLQTLLKRPELAQYFREVELLMVTSDTGIFHDRHDAREGGLSMSELYPAYQLSREMPFEFAARVLSWLRLGRLEAYMAVLFTLLVNVSTVNFRLRGNVMEHLMMKALIHCPRRPIKTLKFTSDSEPSSDIRNFGRWPKKHDIYFALPSILSLSGVESLCVEELGGMSYSFRFPIPVSSTLKSLRLPVSDITELHVGALLEAMPNLEHFECHLGYDHHDDERCDGEILNQALNHVKDTLVSLSIKIDIIRPQPTPWEVVKPLGSLKHFKKMR
jgi:hypothetical protein